MPARLRNMAKAAGHFGIALEPPRSGSHWQFRGQDGVMYPVPAPNGLKSEISDEYINGLCRAFKLIRSEFKRRL